MLDLGWQEFFLIATVAVVVVGPKDLPKVIRTVVSWIRKIRSMARDFQGSIEEVAREAELDEIRKEAAKLTSQDMSKTILDTVDPDRDLADALKETRANVEADAASGENSMLAPNAGADPALEVTLDDTDTIKGWDASTVATPSNSIMSPPAPETKVVKKPRAKRAARAEGSGAPTKPKRKTASNPKGAKTTTVKAKAEATSKPPAVRKSRKPRSIPKVDPGPLADTPATEA
jgi:sec-independent protein translocase protein TatB